MNPWAYTDDQSKPFNAARAMLGEADADTARLTDAYITSTLATFGWQQGMAVMAQRLIVEVGNEVMRASEAGGATYEFHQQRLDGLKQIKAKADQGILPDPEVGPVKQVVPGSIVVGNSPEW